MSAESHADETSKGGSLRKRPETRPCPLCREDVAFLWTCPCGFSMCQACNDDNGWGLTCNGITWTCPDCGSTRSY